MQMKITPRFDVKTTISETIEKDWINLQAGAFDMGKRLHAYMQSFINSHHKRRGGTGRLAKSINF